MTLDQLTQLLMWCSIINIGLMLFSFVLVMAFRTFVCRIHAKLFDLPEDAVRLAMYYFFGIWKVLTFLFFVIPWICLRFII